MEYLKLQTKIDGVQRIVLIPRLSVNFVDVIEEKREITVLNPNGEPLTEIVGSGLPLYQELSRPVGDLIYTREALRQMRKDRSFVNVSETELMLALTAGDAATSRQTALIEQQAADYAEADAWYEALKAANLVAVSELTVAEIDSIASDLGLTWSKSSLTKAEKVAELESAELI